MDAFDKLLTVPLPQTERLRPDIHEGLRSGAFMKFENRHVFTAGRPGRVASFN